MPRHSGFYRKLEGMKEQESFERPKLGENGAKSQSII